MLKQISYYYVQDQRPVPAKALGIKVSVALKSLSIYVLRKDLKQFQLQGGKPLLFYYTKHMGVLCHPNNPHSYLSSFRFTVICRVMTIAKKCNKSCTFHIS